MLKGNFEIESFVGVSGNTGKAVQIKSIKSDMIIRSPDNYKQSTQLTLSVGGLEKKPTSNQKNAGNLVVKQKGQSYNLLKMYNGDFKYKRVRSFLEEHLTRRFQKIKYGTRGGFISKVYWKRQFQRGYPYLVRPFDRYKHIVKDKEVGEQFSALMNQNIKVRSMNFFVYLVRKGLLNYFTHQQHFFHQAYKNRRFRYANFYDVVNAFFILGIMRHTEDFFLNVITLILPQLEKHKRYFYFLDSIITNMPQIKDNYVCFRITINGKLAGGTKRTKTFTIGFGRLPIQSLTAEISNAYTSFTHKYGEFGIKLLMGYNPIRDPL
jgi:hypothetical protein